MKDYSIAVGDKLVAINRYIISILGMTDDEVTKLVLLATE